MPEFLIRHWGEQVLFDCNDYRVEAETLEDAVALLEDQLQTVDDKGPISHPNVSALETYRYDDIRALDPEEVVEGAEGFTLVDADGNRVRDLVGVPTSCPRLGQPLGGKAQLSPEDDCCDILTRLLEWAEHTGGWDAEVWDDAKKLRDRLNNEAEISAT